VKDHSKEGNSERRDLPSVSLATDPLSFFNHAQEASTNDGDDEGGTLKYEENKKERVDGVRLSLPRWRGG